MPRDFAERIKRVRTAFDNRVRMSSSVAAAAAIDRLARGPAGGRRLAVNNHHHHRSHLQRQAQQKGRLALASVASIAAPEAGLHRSLVRRGADRPQVGDHRRPLRSQVSPMAPRSYFVPLREILIDSISVLLKTLTTPRKWAFLNLSSPPTPLSHQTFSQFNTQVLASNEHLSFIFKRLCFLVPILFPRVFTSFSSGYLLQRIVQLAHRRAVDGGGRRVGIGLGRTRIRTPARRESDPAREIQQLRARHRWVLERNARGTTSGKNIRQRPVFTNLISPRRPKAPLNIRATFLLN